MNRRRLLGGVAAVLSGASVAGCSGGNEDVPEMAPPAPAGGGENEPTESDDSATETDEDSQRGAVSIQTYDAAAGTDGNLVVSVTVRNEADVEQVRYVQALVTVGDSELPVGEFVTLAPGSTETVELAVDVQYEAWSGNGGFTPAVLTRTPATPVPTETATATETATTGTPDTATEAPESGETDATTGS